MGDDDGESPTEKGLGNRTYQRQSLTHPVHQQRPRQRCDQRKMDRRLVDGPGGVQYREVYGEHSLTEYH